MRLTIKFVLFFIAIAQVAVLPRAKADSFASMKQMGVGINCTGKAPDYVIEIQDVTYQGKTGGNFAVIDHDHFGKLRYAIDSGALTISDGNKKSVLTDNLTLNSDQNAKGFKSSREICEAAKKSAQESAKIQNAPVASDLAKECVADFSNCTLRLTGRVETDTKVEMRRFRTGCIKSIVPWDTNKPFAKISVSDKTHGTIDYITHTDDSSDWCPGYPKENQKAAKKHIVQ
jgi:hypothetical protein